MPKTEKKAPSKLNVRSVVQAVPPPKTDQDLNKMYSMLKDYLKQLETENLRLEKDLALKKLNRLKQEKNPIAPLSGRLQTLETRLNRSDLMVRKQQAFILRRQRFFAGSSQKLALIAHKISILEGQSADPALLRDQLLDILSELKTIKEKREKLQVEHG